MPDDGAVVHGMSLPQIKPRRNRPVAAILTKAAPSPASWRLKLP